MERIKLYIMSLSKIGLLVAAVLIAVMAFTDVWDVYKMADKCDVSIPVKIYGYKMVDEGGTHPIGYPIAEYEVDNKKYEYTGSTEIGTYPYKENIEATLRYCSYEPETAIFDIEVKEGMNRFIMMLCISGALMILKVVINIKEFYDNRQ